MTLLRVLVGLTIAMLTILAEPTLAQGAASKKKQAPRRVLRLEELKVEGRIHKPQAIFLMPRASPSTGETDRAEPLLPKVTKAVEKEPF